MTKRELYILELINEGLSIQEIQTKLNVSISELSKSLKDIRTKGINLRKTYFSDGTIIIKPNRTLEINPNNNVFRLNIKGKSLKVLFISDLHIGSIHDNPEYIKVVYKYAKEHDIHIIINCGDVIDNVYPNSDQILRSPTVASQLSRLLRIYNSLYREHPELNDIITLNLYGNHDFKSIQDEGLDVSRYIEDKRYDLVSLGYGASTIYVKDDRIGLLHDLKGKSKEPQPNTPITYKGHSHKSKNSIKDEKIIYVPSLSDFSITSYDYKPLVCFLESEFLFYDKTIERVNQRQLAIIDKEIRLANEEALVLKKTPKSRRV